MVIILCEIKENNNGELWIEKQTHSKELSQPHRKGEGSAGDEDR